MFLTFFPSLFANKAEEWIEKQRKNIQKTANKDSIFSENKYIRHCVKNIIFLVDEGAIEYIRWNGGFNAVYESAKTTSIMNGDQGK